MDISLLDKTKMRELKELSAEEIVLSVPEGVTIKEFRSIAGFDSNSFFTINGIVRDMNWILEEGDQVVARQVGYGG